MRGSTDAAPRYQRATTDRIRHGVRPESSCADRYCSSRIRGRTPAPGIWWLNADLTLQYAAEGHARHGRLAQCAGPLGEAACHAAHAILAHRGEWMTNEKQLLGKAGLRGIDGIVGQLGTQPESLLQSVSDARELLLGAVRDEGIASG